MDKDTLAWLSYCYFHSGDYQKALNTYNDNLKQTDADPLLHLYAACCMFYLGMHKEAEQEALKGNTHKI